MIKSIIPKIKKSIAGTNGGKKIPLFSIIINLVVYLPKNIKIIYPHL